MIKSVGEDVYHGTVRLAAGVVGGNVAVHSTVPGITPLTVQKMHNKKYAANSVMGVLLTKQVFEGESVVSAAFRVMHDVHHSADSLGGEVEMIVQGAGVETRATSKFCGGSVGSKGRCAINVKFDSQAFAETSSLTVLYVRRLRPPIFPIFLPHFRLYEVVSVIR